MPAITETARQFFDACETGQGWEGCRAYCTADATFSAQCEPLTELHSVQAYADWMSGLLHALPDGKYEIKSFATDEATASVSVFAVFSASHVGTGGPQPPTGKTVAADYAYIMFFEGHSIRHMVKVWNAGWTMKQLGWV